MEKIPCPGCRTPLDAEVTCCPICTRPRSKYEITRAYTHLREDNARRRKRPFIVAGWLLLASAAGYGAWLFRAPLLSAASSARAKVSSFADYSMDARNLVPARPAETPAASTATAEAPAQAPAAAPSAAAAAAPAAEPPPGPDPKRQAVMPPPAPAASGPVRLEDLHMAAVDPSSHWTLYGRAYDLVSLRAAGNVQLMFQAEGGGVVATATTDNVGRYGVPLPRMQQGIIVLSADNRYAPMVLCEPDIPYRTLPAEERRALARSSLDGDVRPASLADSPGDPSLQRDLFLAPAR